MSGGPYLFFYPSLLPFGKVIPSVYFYGYSDFFSCSITREDRYDQEINEVFVTIGNQRPFPIERKIQRTKYFVNMLFCYVRLVSEGLPSIGCPFVLWDETVHQLRLSGPCHQSYLGYPSFSLKSFSFFHCSSNYIAGLIPHVLGFITGRASSSCTYAYGSQHPLLSDC